MLALAVVTWGQAWQPAEAAGEGTFSLGTVQAPGRPPCTVTESVGCAVEEGEEVTVTVHRSGGSTLAEAIKVTISLHGGNLECEIPVGAFACPNPNDPKWKPDYDPEEFEVEFPAGQNLSQASAKFQTFNKGRTNDMVFEMRIKAVSGGGAIGTPSYAPLRVMGQKSPRVTDVFPRAAKVGTMVTIKGRGFNAVECTPLVGPDDVYFGGLDVNGDPEGVQVTDCQRISDTEMRVTVPAPGVFPSLPVDIVVVVPDPDDPLAPDIPSSPNPPLTRFHFAEGPAIHQMSPRSGTFAGGTTVIINGEGFVGVTDVLFGGVPATDVNVVSSSQVTAKTPAGSGVVDVVVCTGACSGATVSPVTQDTTFTYSGAPEIVLVSPSAGPPAGGTKVTITGSGFLSGGMSAIQQVYFGGNPAVEFFVHNDTTITATTPPGNGLVFIGLEHVNPLIGIVTPPGGGFTYSSGPIVTKLEPASGPTVGGTEVDIFGFNFVAGASVRFGSAPATAVTFIGENRLRAVSPPGSGIVDVVVTVGSSSSPTGAETKFSYGAPVVTQVTPNASGPAGGIDVTIKGTNFTQSAQVTFGTVPVEQVTFVSPTELKVKAPASGFLGEVHVRVKTISGESAEGPGSLFTYTNGPIVAGINPTSGVISGGTIIVITGQNFQAPATVRFSNEGGIQIETTIVNVNTENQITVLSPAVPDGGAFDVQVIQASGVSPKSPLARFTYVAHKPVVEAIEPAESINFGGVKITITGSGFLGVVCPGGVLFGSKPAQSCEVIDDGTIEAITPSHVSGPTVVTVTNPAGTSAIEENFTFVKFSGGTSGGDGSPLISERSMEYQLGYRWTLITWGGLDGTRVDEALAGPGDGSTLAGSILSIYTWDAEEGRWLVYSPAGDGIPGANDLTEFWLGAAYWVETADPNGVSWTVVTD
ncbi:MAG: hypothetical protein Kow0010_06130 [Dehalococcoidia bacterium]